MIDSLLSYVAPHSCCSCGEIGLLLCESCKFDIVSEGFSVCVFCEKPTRSGAICGGCRASTGITDAWCVGYRDGSMKALLDAYKFRSSREADRHLAELLDARLPIVPDDVVISWVPTAPGHIRSRGMDHTRQIAKHLAKRHDRPTQAYLDRISGEMQHFKTRAARLSDVERSIVSRSAVPGQVLIIDDILTTGATMMACAKKLRQAGATDVYVAIVARQPGWNSQ